MLKRILLIVFVYVPIIAWFMVKPVRVLTPTLFGITCINDVVCVDNTSKSDEALNLYNESIKFVSEKISNINGHPKVIFCYSQQCTDAFGLGSRSALTFGSAGTVISHTAWKPYYIRHELIHYLQNEKLGVINVFFMPRWLIEGMAYSLSDDPRPVLAEPWQHYKNQFNLWYKQVGHTKLWQEAAKL